MRVLCLFMHTTLNYPPRCFIPYYWWVVLLPACIDSNSHVPPRSLCYVFFCRGNVSSYYGNESEGGALFPLMWEIDSLTSHSSFSLFSHLNSLKRGSCPGRPLLCFRPFLLHPLVPSPAQRKGGCVKVSHHVLSFNTPRLY